MKVVIVTKPGCPRCLLLKQKLELLGVEWEELDEPPPGVMVEYAKLPIVLIGGEPYEYAEAMKRLKEAIRGSGS